MDNVNASNFADFFDRYFNTNDFHNNEEQEDEELDQEELKAVSAASSLEAQNFTTLHPLESRELPELLANWQSEFKNTRQRALLEVYFEHFAEWRNMLQQDFHLCFYGLGSKKLLLEEFVLNEISPLSPVVILNGYYPHLKSKNFIRAVKNILRRRGIKPHASGMQEDDYIDWIRREYSRQSEPLYIMIHNLDELNRWGPSLWKLISERLIPGGSNIRLILSVDHGYSACLIPSSLPCLWIECTTGMPYKLEGSYSSSFPSYQSSSFASNAASFRSSKGNSKLVAKSDEEMFASALVNLEGLASESLLCFCILGQLLARKRQQQQLQPPNDMESVPIDLLCNAMQVLTFMQRSTVEANVNQFEKYKLISISTSKSQTILKSKIPNQVMNRILDHFVDTWIIYADDLQLIR